MLETVVKPAGVSPANLQLALNNLNRWRMTPSLPYSGWESDCNKMAEIAKLERSFIEESRRKTKTRAATAPSDPAKFIKWFENLKGNGPGQGDPLFSWLANHCSLSEMKWFLTQEVAGEAGFDDLTALTQLRLPVRPKLELARNYWDEMGRGNSKAMHGPLLHGLASYLGLKPEPENVVEESLALANTMAGLAANRCYAFHSIGALGVIEMTAPGRSAATAAGLKRLGVGSKPRTYFSLHAILDVKHSAAWNAEAIMPLIAEDPRRSIAIAEGALMRLEAGARCFARYRRHFGLS
jgi:hypothetical protein